MQPKILNKYLLPLAIASAVSTSVIAATADYSVGFTTVPDITITELQAMDFGSFLGLASGAACTMAVTAPATAATYPGNSVMRLATGSADAAGADVGKLTTCGSAGANDTGTIGLYEIQGIAGGTVNITVSDITAGADFNFDISGCVGNYNNAGLGDTCKDVNGSGAQTAILATAGDTVGNDADSGIPQPGSAVMALGGTITSTSVHTAGLALTESFTITVTY